MYSPLYGFGAEYVAPKGFKWPSEADYAAELIKSVSTMMPEVGVSSDRAIISPAIQTQVNGLSGTLEAASGKGLGSLASLAGNISSLAQSQTPAQIVGAVGDLLNTSLDITASALEAFGAAVDVIEVVPIVGQIVGAVFGIIGAILSMPTYEELKEDCRIQLDQELTPVCRKLSEESQKFKPTGFSGGNITVSAADLFRPLAYRYWQGDRRWPANISSLMLMLCGGAAGDFGISELHYQRIVEGMRKGKIHVTGAIYLPVKKNPKAGMPLATRAKLWQLIQATMACVQNPDDPRPTVLADQARSVMPIMLDIFREAQDRKQIDNVMLKQLALMSLGWTSRKKVCQPAIIGKVGEIAAHGSCAPKLAPDLVETFEETVRRFRTKLSYEFGASLGPYSIHASPPSILKVGAKFAKLVSNPKGAIVLPTAVMKRMVQTQQDVAAAARGDTNKALTWTGVVLAGGGAFLLARRAAR